MAYRKMFLLRPIKLFKLGEAEIFQRQGISLDRGTLGNWVGRACFHLGPVIEHMRRHLREARRLLIDETRAPVFDPGRRRTKSG